MSLKNVKMLCSRPGAASLVDGSESVRRMPLGLESGDDASVEVLEVLCKARLGPE
jgi:hypothetical protein